MFRITFLGAFLVFSNFAFNGVAAANPAVCTKLQRQLASIQSSDGSKNRYDRAVSQKKIELNNARIAARKAGCGGGILSSGPSRAPQCASHNRTIQKLSDNVARLERSSRSSITNAAASRQRILASLRANGCNENAGNRTAAAPERKSLFQHLFGGSTRSNDDFSAKARANEQGLSGQKMPAERQVRNSQEPSIPSGKYRTLCVRTCDGYYFPIAYASSPSNFDRDTKICSAMCPGTEAKLYYHSVPDQESEDMVSISGEPYVNLVTAFKYREAKPGSVANCRCRPQPTVNYTAMNAVAGNDAYQVLGEYEPTGRGTSAAIVASTSNIREQWIAAPRRRPDAGADPENALNKEGGLDRAAVNVLLSSDQVTNESGRKIRVVGPVFLPAQEAAINLRAPAPIRHQ